MERFFTEFTLSEAEWVHNDALTLEAHPLLSKHQDEWRSPTPDKCRTMPDRET